MADNDNTGQSTTPADDQQSLLKPETTVTGTGLNLLTSVGGGKGSLTYTRAALYSQDISQMTDAQLIALTSLDGEEMSVPISGDDVRVNGNNCNVTIGFENAKVEKDLTFNSVGWFGESTNEGKEVLMAVTALKKPGLLIAGSNSTTTASIEYELAVTLANGTVVNVTPSSIGTIDRVDLENAIKDLEDRGLIYVDKDLTADDDFKLIFNTFLRYINNVKPKNGPDDFSGTGWLLSIGEADKNKDAVHVLYDTRTNIEYIQYFNEDKQLWSDWVSFVDSTTLKSAIDKAGKIKSFQVNGTNVDPDANGNINLELDNYLKNYVKTVQGNGPDADGEVKLPINVATSYNPATKVPTVVRDNLGTDTLVTTQALEPLANDYIDHENRITTLEKNQFLVQTFKKTDEAKATAWANADPLHRLAMIQDS